MASVVIGGLVAGSEIIGGIISYYITGGRYGQTSASRIYA